ncbi:NAD(P)/FAD-dependent oxidoreductase [archaeon]|nr:NAD(P)/FAD-dependent oxidoreductase [archaeon]
MKFDVAVVGAGPAGSSVAKFASEAGLRVIVLERKKETGFPSPCAGYVSKLVSRHFSIDKACIQQEVKNMRTYSPSGEVQTAGMEGFIVDRPLFDNALGRQAKDAGAEILKDARVTGLIKKEGHVRGVVYKKNGEEKEIESKVVVGADGIFSRVAKWSGLQTQDRKEIAICPQYEMAGVELDDPTITETYFGVSYAPGAYVWVYPTGKNSAKVGLGIKKSLARMKPKEYLNKFIAEHPTASLKFKNAKITGTLTGLVPVGGPLNKTYADGVLLVGDAAGMTDAISGAGIISGILAGKLAAGVVSEAVAEDDCSEEKLKKYEELWKKVLGSRLRRSLEKRKIVDRAYSSDEELEKVLPWTWITFKEFWKD